MACFNFSRVAEEAEIPPERLRELCEMMRRDFPTDDMLYELHVLRACMAIRDGHIHFDDLFHSDPMVQPA